jgi:hypothetical protein
MVRQPTRVELIRQWATLTSAAKYSIAKQYIEENWVGHPFFKGESAHDMAMSWSMSRFSELSFGHQSAVLDALKNIGRYKVTR